MLNAEDTKERIRKLRLKVISDPTDIYSKSNTQVAQKPTKEWEDKLLVNNENKESFSDTEANGTNEKQSNENKNLILNKFKEFSKIKKNPVSNIFSQNDVQNEIDNRIKNNSKLILELFNERVESLKNQIVSSDNFDKFQDQIIENINTKILDFTEKLDSKINEFRKKNNEKEIELTNLIKENSNKLESRTYEKMDSFSEKIADYENKIPQIINNLEEKIYEDINSLVTEFSSKIKEETDKNLLNNEVVKKDFLTIVDNLENQVQIKIADNFSQSNSNIENLENNIELKINSLKNIISSEQKENNDEFIKFKDNIDTFKRSFDDFKDSMGIKSDALISEISFQIDDLNSNFVTKFDDIYKELENTKVSVNHENKELLIQFDEKFKNLEDTISSIATNIYQDNQALKSELNNRVNNIEDNSIKEISHFKNKIEKKIEFGLNSLNEIKVDFENKINENNYSINKINQVNEELKESYELIEANSILKSNEFEKQINDTKKHSNELHDKTNFSVDRIKKEFEDGQKSIISEIDSKIKQLNDKIRRSVEDTSSEFSKKLNDNKKDSDSKIKIFASKFGNLISENKKYYAKILEDLSSDLSESKSTMDQKFSELRNNISESNNEIVNCKKDFFDTQKQLEIKFSETQKEVLGLFKDKYKTLKSMIWEEISNLKQLDNNTLEKVSKIEKIIVSEPELKNKIKKQLIYENKKFNSYLNNQLDKINDTIQEIENRILNEKELKEIFENHSLNVNISQNKKLLSKVQKDYEKHNKGLRTLFISPKMIPFLILIVSLFSIVKIFS